MANIPRLKALIAESGLDALILAGRKNTLYLRDDLLFRDAMYNSTNDGWILMLCVIVPPDRSFTVGARGLNLPDLPTETCGTDDYVKDYLAVTIDQLKKRDLHRGRIGLDAGLSPDWNICYQGYMSDFKLPLCFGEPTQKAVETVNGHVQRIAFMYDAVRPGKTKREVFEACRREFNAERSDAPLWLVHGVGMDVHEEPRMSSAYPSGHERVAPEIVFEEGNVLSLEGSWLVEEAAVLERDGPKRIGNAGTREINVI